MTLRKTSGGAATPFVARSVLRPSVGGSPIAAIIAAMKQIAASTRGHVALMLLPSLAENQVRSNGIGCQGRGFNAELR
jgi:hypothetical protein